MPDNNGTRYCWDLQRNVDAYIEGLNENIKLCWSYGDILDKQNAHRLADLCVHTVSIFRDALFVSEIVLDMVHRGSKNWPETSTHYDYHITGVDVALGRNWDARLYALL